jgi:glycosyltransferase involved in cell wall biosynthesis
MIVLVNCLSSVSGGAVSYLRNIVPRLFNLFNASVEGHKLRLLVHESQLPLFPRVPTADCIIIAGPRMYGYNRGWWELRNISHIAAETKADVLFYPCQVGVKVKGIKTLFMLHNMEPFYYHDYKYNLSSRIRNYLLRHGSWRSIAQADRVIAVSKFVENYLHHTMRIHPSRIRRIYHGSDESFGPIGDLSSDIKLLNSIGIHGDFILTCGSLLPYRRCEDVIAAFSRIETHVKNGLTLVIVGTGTEQYERLLKRKIVESGVSDRTRILGFVSPEFMKSLYRCCRICVVASEVEACPTIAIEAIEAGCVIVASDTPPLIEILDGAAAFFPSRKIPALVESMRRCLSDVKFRKELSGRSRIRALDFSWDRCARETYSALVDWAK